MAAYQLADPTFGDGTNKQFPIRERIDYLFVGLNIIDTDEDLTDYVNAGVLQSLTDAEVTAQGGATTTVTPVEDEASLVVQIGSDAALALLSTTGTVYLDESTTGTKTITTTSTSKDQIIDIFLAAASGGEYELAVEGGTLTFNAALEYARIQRNAQDDGWKAIDLIGATVV